MPAACEIRPAQPEEMDLVRVLFREYQAFIAVDLCFQSFEEELAGLPGRYAPPQGAILIAGDGAGVVALRAIDPFTAEMKRLFVRPSQQGTGLGRALAQRAGGRTWAGGRAPGCTHSAASSRSPRPRA